MNIISFQQTISIFAHFTAQLHPSFRVIDPLLKFSHADCSVHSFPNLKIDNPDHGVYSSPKPLFVWGRSGGGRFAGIFRAFVTSFVDGSSLVGAYDG